MIDVLGVVRRVGEIELGCKKRIESAEEQRSMVREAIRRMVEAELARREPR